VEVARLLLDRGARVEARDNAGNTPLHEAVYEGREDVVRLLMARKADPDAANKVGATPLYLAAWTGRARLAALLLRHKANVDRQAPELEVQRRRSDLVGRIRVGLP